MDDQTENQTPLSWISPPDRACEIYANASHVTWTVDDVRIRLGQMVQDPNRPTPGKDFRGVIEERAAITITWRIAKAAALDLLRAVQHYEEVNGEIKLDVKLPGSIP